MKRQAVGWGVALAGAGVTAILLLASALQVPESLFASPTPRDVSQISDVERELILNKVREGDLRAARNDIPGARRAWSEARRLGEGLWPIHEGLGDSLVRVRLYEEAVQEYLKASASLPERLAPVRATLHFKRGEALAAAGRSLEAVQAYLETGEAMPLAARILEQARKADRDRVLTAVSRRAEAYDPKLFGLLAQLQEAFDRKSEAAEALATYCIAVRPWDVELNQKAIQGLRAARSFDRAIEVCRAWVRSSPQMLGAYEIMGDLHLEAGREKEAMVAYSSMVDIRPGDSGAHQRLGEIYRRLGRLDEAIGQFEAARKARPEDESTYATLSELFQQKGDSGRAEETLLEACKRFGSSASLRSSLVALLQGKIDGLKKAGKTQELHALRQKLGELNVPEAGLFDLKIIMTWDAKSDVDLDVLEPGGETINHGYRQSKAGGRYYVDNTTAYGPETYTLKSAPPGTYRIGAHLHGEVRSTVKIRIILFEDTPREERREETLILEKSGDPTFLPPIQVAK